MTVDRTDLSQCVQEVRMSRGNSLSGLTVQEIVSLVKNVIVKNQLMPQQQQQHSQVSVFIRQVHVPEWHHSSLSSAFHFNHSKYSPICPRRELVTFFYIVSKKQDSGFLYGKFDDEIISGYLWSGAQSRAGWCLNSQCYISETGQDTAWAIINHTGSHV